MNESTGKVAKLEPANRLSVFCIAIDAHHCRGMWVCTKSLLDIDLTCDVPPGAVSIVFAFVLPESGSVELRLATGDFRANPAYLTDCTSVLQSAKEKWPQWFSQLDPVFTGT